MRVAAPAVLRGDDHRGLLAAIAIAIAAGAFAAVATAAGWTSVWHVVQGVQPAWLAAAVAGQVVGVVGYAVAWRHLAALRHVTLRDAVLVVLAGFGAHLPAGSLAVDRRALERGTGDADTATVHVLRLGALEYGVLAPAAWACAVGLLLTGSRAAPSLLWPWALAVPVGFAIGLWAAAPERRERISQDTRLGRGLRRALEGVGVLHELGRRPRAHAAAWLGMAVYWVADIASLGACLALFGVDIGGAELVLAYATGYAATRRTLPLGGVGITAALMSLALGWVGVGLAGAVAAVAAYRVVNVVLPVVPALWADRRLEVTQRRLAARG